MTIERAIELLQTGSKFPEVFHMAEEVDEACQKAISALKAQKHLEPYAEADQKGRLHILPPENSVAQCLDLAKQVTDMGLTMQQALDILRAQQEQPTEPLTLDELRQMARNGGYVWCADTDGMYPGLLCYVECLLDNGKEAHIWLLDNEGNAGQYNVRCMIECGANFYRRKPERKGVENEN